MSLQASGAGGAVPEVSSSSHSHSRSHRSRRSRSRNHNEAVEGGGGGRGESELFRAPTAGGAGAGADADADADAGVGVGVGVGDVSSSYGHSHSHTTKLYSRGADMVKLVDAYEHRSLRHLVLSVGGAGVGKTALMMQTLRVRVEQDGGFFVQGQYDELDQPEPFGPWIDAAEQLLEQLIDRCDELSLAQVMKSLQQAMEPSELQALATLLPMLGELMDLTPSPSLRPSSSTSWLTSSSSSSSSNTRYNFLTIFGNFLRGIAHPSRPMVWFLDDVQKADATSLELVKLLLADPQLSNVLVAIAFRPVSVQHPTSVLLQTLEAAGVGMVPILPSPIEEVAILEWLQASSDLGPVLLQDTALLKKMATTIREGSCGNALAIQLCLNIMQLNKEIVLATGGGTPLQQASGGGGGDIIATLFRLLLQMVSSECQRVLRTAACIGRLSIDRSLLSQIQTCDLPKVLVEAERHGILQFHHHHYHHHHHHNASGKDGDDDDDDDNAADDDEQDDDAPIITKVPMRKSEDLQNLQRGYYTFTTSTYREFFYASTPPNERSLQHTAIGNLWRPLLPEVGVFRVVAHMALGADHLAPKAHELLIRYCLEAGRQASQWQAFNVAANYLQLGMQFSQSNPLTKTTMTRTTTTTTTLPFHRQATNNNRAASKNKKEADQLALALYCEMAEVSRCLEKYEEMTAALESAARYVKEAPDRLWIATIEVQAFLAQAKHMEAITVAMKVLQKIQEPLKAKSTDMELKTIRKLLEGRTEESLLLLQTAPLTDPKLLGVMELLNLMIVPALVVQGNLVPVLACRMVKMLLLHGYTRASSVGMCLLGVVLCQEGAIDMGIWCSDVGLEFVEGSDNKDSKGRVMALHWGLLSRFVKPWGICQEPLKVAYRACVKGSDSEFALITPVLSILNMVAAGVPLQPLMEAMKSIHHLLERKKQDTLKRMLRPFYQMSLNLIGASPEHNPVVLTGGVMNQEDDMRHVHDNSNIGTQTVECCLLWCQASMNFYMHKFETSRELLLLCRNILQQFPQVLLSSLQIPMECLNAHTAVRLLWRIQLKNEEGGAEDKKRQRSLLAAVNDSLNKLQDLAKHAPDNVQHKVYMIQGELEALDGRVNQAMISFQKAIDLAEDHGAIADKALFCEQAGLTLRLCNKEDQALDYLEDCCACYRRWGALIKVNHVKGNVIPEAIHEWED